MKQILAIVSGVALLSTVARADPPPPPLTGSSYWVGGKMPEPMAQQTFDFLTGEHGPLGNMLVSFFLFNNANGQYGQVLNYQPEKAWNGYTLLSALGGAYLSPNGTFDQTILIDMNGAVVKSWPMRTMPAKMLPGGDVIAGEGNGLTGHVEITRLVQMDWCGQEKWSFEGDALNPPPGGARWHHDFQREGSPTGYYAPGQVAKSFGGKTLVLVHENPDLADTGNVSDFALEEDVFYEVDQNGRVGWKWYPWQHVDQMGFDAHARKAIRTQRVSDPGFVGGGALETDWQHINSLSWLGPNQWYDAGNQRFHPDNLIWDGRSSNLIAIVARHAGSDASGSWNEGDIVWRLGPEYGAGAPWHKVGQIIGQHHAHIIPAGLPGAGNLLVFDNGGLAGFGDLFPGMDEKYVFWPNKYRSYSRVLEINPITYELVWEYQMPESTDAGRKFFSWFISSAQRLLNGNTMITEGSNGRVFEVTPAGEIVWEYISPFRSQSILKNATYRAYRIPEEWLPLNRTCPQPPEFSHAGGNK